MCAMFIFEQHLVKNKKSSSSQLQNGILKYRYLLSGITQISNGLLVLILFLEQKKWFLCIPKAKQACSGALKKMVLYLLNFIL